MMGWPMPLSGEEEKRNAVMGFGLAVDRRRPGRVKGVERAIVIGGGRLGLEREGEGTGCCNGPKEEREEN
jgi:hypothetical protein